MTETDYKEAQSVTDVDQVVDSLAPEAALAVAVELDRQSPEEEEEEIADEEPQEAMLPLTDGAPASAPEIASRRIAISASAGVSHHRQAGFSPAATKLRSVLTTPRRQNLFTITKRQSMPSTLSAFLCKASTMTQCSTPICSIPHTPRTVSRMSLSAASISSSAAISPRPPTSPAGSLQLFATKFSRQDSPGSTKKLISRSFLFSRAWSRLESRSTPRALATMSTELQREIAVKEKEIHQIAGTEFNVGSPKQLGDVLFNRLNLAKPIKYGKGRVISTAVDVLETLAEDHPIARMVLDYRQLTKLKSTYVDTLPALIKRSTGRVHTTFGQTGTATGRLSSTNPNLQNIPIRTELGRGIRAAFIAEPGHVLLTADYSQIELRLLAHFSKDRLLVEAYRRGDDIHTLTASQVFGVPPLMVTSDHRRAAKVVNFGIVYGLSPFGLSQNLGIEPSEAKQFIAAYFEKYAGVRTFIDKILEEARRDLKVKTLFGRIRPIPDINSKNSNQRGFAERTAVNTPLQGTAADLIKIAMIRIDSALRERELKSRMTLQVHDELVFEVPEEEVDIMKSLVREEMENVHALAVPLLVEMGVGPNWRDLE